MNSTVISMVSGKGGVGKTSLVANLGALLSKTKKTLLVDADWTLGKLSIALGVKPNWNLDAILKGERDLKSILFPVKENLSLIASPSGAFGFEELNPYQRQQLFWELDSCMEEFDITFLDHSSGIAPSVLEFAAASHHQIVALTSEPTSLADAYAIMKLLSKKYSTPQFSIIATMCHDTAESEKKIARFLDWVRTQLGVKINLLSLLPWDESWSQQLHRQKLVIEEPRARRVTLKLEQICEKILDLKPATTNGVRFLYQQSLNQKDTLCQL